MTKKSQLRSVTLNQIKDQTDWDAVRSMKDSEISHDDENPVITPQFWKTAPIVEFPANKTQVTLRIDDPGKP